MHTPHATQDRQSPEHRSPEGHGPGGCRPALDRRTLLRSAAWAAPAIAVVGATPAFAASACVADTAYAVRWSTSTWAYAAAADGMSGAGTIAATTVAPPAAGTRLDALDVHISNQFFGNMRGRTDSAASQGNMWVTPHNVGGTSRPGLELWNALTHNNARNTTAVATDRQEVTIDFGREVKNVTFTITDLDSHMAQDDWFDTNDRWQYIDAVRVGVATTGVSRGSAVSGSGTAASPWRSSATPATSGSGLSNITGTAGNVTLTIPGPVTRFTVTFFNQETRRLLNNGSQAIYLSDFTFTANTCA